MEFIRYWQIIRKYWWLTAALLLLVGLISLLSYDWNPPQMHAASFRFNVGLEPVAPEGVTYEYNPLDVWMTSEYFMDDLASAVRGVTYAQRVAGRLEGIDANLAGVFGAFTEHRVLTVSIQWRDPDQLAQIAQAAIAVLQEEAGQMVGPLGQARPVLRLIDPPVVAPVGRSLKDQLDIPIRLGLALAAGIAGAFLFDYLDVTVRDRTEVEAMGIAVLGQIPRHK